MMLGPLDKVMYIVVFNMQRKCNAGCKRDIRGGEHVDQVTKT